MGLGEQFRKGMTFFLMCFGVSTPQKPKPRPKPNEGNKETGK
jgi:hypothetical protein